MKTVRKMEDILNDMMTLVKEARNLVSHPMYEFDEKWIEEEARVLEEDRLVRSRENLTEKL